VALKGTPAGDRYNSEWLAYDW